MKVVAVDPYIKEEEAKNLNVELVNAEYVLENADIISNHMNQNNTNDKFFTIKEFRKMKKKPIFINVGRGSSVNEGDLLKAIDENLIRGAGLDVLTEENPCLENNKLVGRKNVIITPHAAFYSETSMKELQRISCENIVYYLNGEKEKVNRIVNYYQIKYEDNGVYHFGGMIDFFCIQKCILCKEDQSLKEMLS
eukprot:TRINITY_DN5341_c0_g1_i2.p1 TRINITY_DN5341_c0_g1~~TRINITY_DN5341_c0_g1_i2.p1  ORF type:complete len:194 (-),score=28.38 TRINITY_DN5341_c0_g1_i2:194-775(-)